MEMIYSSLKGGRLYRQLDGQWYRLSPGGSWELLKGHTKFVSESNNGRSYLFRSHHHSWKVEIKCLERDSTSSLP
jgi:hypothetical protein